jgi:hypothetical protein
MADEERHESTAARRARSRAERRERKRFRQKMGVSGKSVFLIKRLIQERAEAAQKASRLPHQGMNGSAGRRPR